MPANKCPKCGFITIASAVSCKNCSYNFTSSDSRNASVANLADKQEKPTSAAETFCALNFVACAIVAGIILCLYWNAYVLSLFLPSGKYPLILLIILYLPAGILAIALGFFWYSILRSILKAFGANFPD